ncbi:hypothetical protein [Vitiosangium sp. GDMCC 1.1324]|uniref:hypothetical protein n=1 Tax=Vitiosangium sp. (strain GDMCC 1.1324) TaxID=2138576 RepID=UPI000D3C9714|nr:hypothetical protein [Vitiosangium sp. GDMCC 1.1324]PTL85261.1 hypothetical protein DAT35_00610 [Vitiosangium sp. GDMCC 1.1324]
MRRFPLRTLLLMTLALVAFVRLYFITHRAGRQAERPTSARTEPVVIETTPRSMDAGSPASAQACRTLDRTLEGAIRAPSDASASSKARQQLDACPEPPARACELGAALDARSPLDTGTTPLRELLDALCQRCPAGTNPCAGYVTRAVMGLGVGRPAEFANVRWHLEHAGPGTPAACAEVVHSLLAPAALATAPLAAPQKELLAQLAPACARAGQLPANILHAVVVQGDVPALAQLVQEKPAGENAVLKPSRTVGPQDAEKAFDGQESTGVELTLATPPTERWEKDGALSAVFEPPVHQLTALRVRAKGPGTLRAAVRTSEGLGMNDPDSQTSFVLPVACRFRGTGQWETCTLPASLLDVEALSVFPDKGKLTLSEVAARGAR